MFRIKICGITSSLDARAATDAGADAIGLNFYRDSPRHCSLAAAHQIVAALPPGVCRVGVFVNAAPDEIRQAVQALRLDLVQLHGDEPPELLRALRPIPVMRALRLASEVSSAAQYLTACYRAGCLPRMLLLDAAAPGSYGGTGQLAPWELIAASRPSFLGLPLVLAGGLKPDNVAAAIAAVRPWGVDTASGVEDSPGKKSAERIGQFVSEAMAAGPLGQACGELNASVTGLPRIH